MASVKDIRDYLESRVPSSLKMDFDNVGFLVGVESAEVKKALVALDITHEVIEEAREFGAELILSHHPLFFQLKRVTSDDVQGAKAVELIRAGISAICLHTNLDAVIGGVNDALMSAVGAQVTGVLDEESGIGRVGHLPESMTFLEFLYAVRNALSAGGLRYHDAGRAVQSLAVCGGSGGGDIALAASKGCDTYLTADVKYDQFLLARDLGINLVDAGHFPTENVVTPVLAGLLATGFPEVEVRVSRRHAQVEQYI